MDFSTIHQGFITPAPPKGESTSSTTSVPASPEVTPMSFEDAIRHIRGAAYDPDKSIQDNLVEQFKNNNGTLTHSQPIEIASIEFTCPAELENMPLHISKEIRVNSFHFEGRGQMHLWNGHIFTSTPGANLFVHSRQAEGTAHMPSSTVTAHNGATAGALQGGKAIAADAESILKKFDDGEASCPTVLEGPPDAVVIDYTLSYLLSGYTFAEYVSDNKKVSTISEKTPDPSSPIRQNEVHQPLSAQRPEDQADPDHIDIIKGIRGDAYDPIKSAHDNLIEEFKKNDGKLHLVEATKPLIGFNLRIPPELSSKNIYLPKEMYVDHFTVEGTGTLYFENGIINAMTAGVTLVANSPTAGGAAFAYGAKVIASNGARALAGGGGEVVALDNSAVLRRAMDKNDPRTRLEAKQKGTWIIDYSDNSYNFMTKEDGFVLEGTDRLPD